jgi:hypothetical protein
MILDSPIITGSLIQQAGQTAEIPRYTAVSSSFLAASASINQRLNELSTDSGSQALRLNSLEAKSASVDTSLSAINSFTQSFSSSVATSISASNANISALSASVSTVTGDFSSSVATSFSASAASTNVLSASIDTRLDVIESSFATTGSNTFKGTQIMSGSLYVTENLIVQGTSSIQNITGSAVSIGTNTVLLNTATPAVRFGGISVQDSGSTSGTGSLWWDSVNNHWIYENPSGAAYSSAILIAGPKNTGSLGNEIGLTTGYLPVASGDDHISDSIITQTGGNKIIVNGTLQVTGPISASNGLVSSSAQLTASYDNRYVLSGSITQTTWDNIANKPGGIISGSEQTTASLDLRYRQVGTPITFTELTEKPTLISGSAQFVTLTDPFTGSFTGSFKGDGSLLTGLTGGGKIHTQTTSAATWTFTHNLNVQYPNVTVYNNSGQIVLPQTITATDVNTLVLEFGTPVAGYAVAGIGGIIEVNGRTVKQSFTSSLEWRFEHNFGDRFVNIQTFDSNYEKIIPQTIVLTDNTSSLITFPEAAAGWAIGTIGGDLPSISSSYAGYVLQVSAGSPYTASWTPIAYVTASNAVNSLTASYLNSLNQNVIPATNVTYSAYSLGDPTHLWDDLYIGGFSNLEQGARIQPGYGLGWSNNTYFDTNNSQTTNIRTIVAGQTIANFYSRSVNINNEYANTGYTLYVEGTGKFSGNICSTGFSGSIYANNGVVSGSSQVDVTLTNNYSTFSSSIATTDLVQTNRLNSIESLTGSLATTGSNTFKGTTIMSGSTYVTGDLIVIGSSSIQYISASSVSIGTNIVTLNTSTPAVRYAGISVQDSGSSAGVTGSILWDSVCNRWLYSNPSGVGYSGGIIMSGPRAATFGTETTLTCNYIAKSGGGDHLYDSAIYESGSCVGIGTSLPLSTLHICGQSGTAGLPSLLLYGESPSNGQRYGFNVSADQLDVSALGTNARISFFTGGNASSITERFRIASNGVACFACDLTAKTIGTNDLRLSNLNYECANYVDGTRGSWLIQEGENDLFIINQISCKKYKFNLIEIK